MWTRWLFPRRNPVGPFEILCWNRFFNSALPDDPRWQLPPHRVHGDRSRLRQADVVLFHLPNLSPATRFPRKHRGQIWAALTYESDLNYPHQADPAFMHRFDVTMSYRQSADIPLDYYWPTRLEDYLRPPAPKTEQALAALFISNGRPVSAREEYLDRLGAVMPVDRYGRHRNNRTLPEDRGRATLLETLARYRFGLAFENAIDRDYVSEKFFQCLVAGTVPVYLGAPNAGEFAPAEGCFIDASTFPSPEALGAHLREVAADESAYHAWREKPLRPSFLRRLEESLDPPILRLVNWVARHRSAGRAA